MKITLDQNEIETAVRNYVNEQVSVKEGQTIDIDFTAGRGTNGLTATVDIRSAGSVVELAKETMSNTATQATPAAAQSVSAETVAASTEAGETSDGDEAAAEDAPAPVEGKTTNSLFNGLNKPKNTP